MNPSPANAVTFTRRRFSLWGAAALAGLPAVPVLPLRAQTPPAPAAPASPARLYLGDMHSHYGMFLPRLLGLDMARHLRDNGATLVAWAATDDHRWTKMTPNGWKQSNPPEPGELWASFQQRIAGYQKKLDQWGVPKALTAADVDAALAGEPRVLLATEGASFLEGRPERVALAHAWGVRHMQLLHFIPSPLGDIQTADPLHGGLTPTGAKVVAECTRLGMVVDMAHGSAAYVDGVLDATSAVPVWSHSWITPQGGDWAGRSYLARSLALPTARKIAARGGAVGLWTVRVNNDPAYPVRSVKTYADEIMRMSDLLGPEHVAFGTDMEGAGQNPILSDYADLREVADNLAKRGLSEALLQGVFIGNYARIVKQAMNGAKT